MPNFFIISGCNGAGKTTAAFSLMPDIIECKEFVNADIIAKGLSPFQPEKVSFEAGRIMLHRISELIERKEDFAIETTLSTISYLNYIQKAKQKGYTVILIYIWLDSVDLAKYRVAERVQNGGHNIPEDIIERRYKKGIINLPKFIKFADDYAIYDNSNNNLEPIFENNKTLNLLKYKTILK